MGPCFHIWWGPRVTRSPSRPLQHVVAWGVLVRKVHGLLEHGAVNDISNAFMAPGHDAVAAVEVVVVAQR